MSARSCSSWVNWKWDGHRPGAFSYSQAHAAKTKTTRHLPAHSPVRSFSLEPLSPTPDTAAFHGIHAASTRQLHHSKLVNKWKEAPPQMLDKQRSSFIGKFQGLHAGKLLLGRSSHPQTTLIGQNTALQPDCPRKPMHLLHGISRPRTSPRWSARWSWPS